MSDLQRLKAELEAQDRELAEAFEQLAQLDPDLELAVSPDFIAAFSADSTPLVAPAPWAVRG